MFFKYLDNSHIKQNFLHLDTAYVASIDSSHHQTSEYCEDEEQIEVLEPGRWSIGEVED